MLQALKGARRANYYSNSLTSILLNKHFSGVWFLHCHLDRHLTWGMQTVFIVKNGNNDATSLLPRPLDMPPC